MKIYFSILKKYGFHPQELIFKTHGYRNKIFVFRLYNNKKIILIQYKNEQNILEKIKNANNIGNFLYENGFVSRHNFNLDSRILKSNKHFFSIYDFIDGQTVMWNLNKKQIYELGSMMSLMHKILNFYEKKQDIPSFKPFFLKKIKQIQKYIKKNTPFIKNKLHINIKTQNIEKLFFSIKDIDLYHQIPLHLDFVRSNILFDKDLIKIVGVLDFEKTMVGAPIVDISRTIAFLLTDTNKPFSKVEKYFFKHFENKQNIKIQYLHDFVISFLLVDLYNFLLHNPYEYLKYNKHFRKTLTILLQDKKYKLISII